MRGRVLLIMLICISAAVYAVAQEEFEKDFSRIGTNYGKVKFAYLDSDGDGSYEYLAMIGNDGSELRLIKFSPQASVVWAQNLERANSFALAGIDLEGKGYKNYIAAGTKKVVVYDLSGNEVWSYDTGSTVYSIVPLDLNGDGKENEMIVGLWGKVVALDSTGKELWSHAVSGRGDKIVALDYNGDGIRDSVAIALSNRVEVVNPLGKVVASISAYYFKKNIARIGSVETDSGSRIIVLEVDGRLQGFTLKGEKLWQSSVYLDNPEMSKIITIDKNKFAVFTGFIYLYDSEGNGLWIYSQTMFNDISPADINGDGNTDFFGCTDKKIYAIVDGQQVGYYVEDSKEISPYNRTGANYIAAIDMDGDGALDDVLGVTDTEIFVLSHKQKQKAVKRIIVVANTIDYKLATDFFDWLREAGFEPIHVFPEQFDSYKKEKLIVILGGHRAPEGTGSIVGDLLTPEEKAELEQKGAIKYFHLRDIYTVGQHIYIFAGNTREETKAAHREFRRKLL